MTKAGKKTSILDVFTDSGLGEKFDRLNSEAQTLLKKLGPFISSLKDEASRLNFLSNQEFLALYSEVSLNYFSFGI